MSSTEVLNEFRPSGHHVLLVTGVLAETGLRRIMEAIDPKDFTYDIKTTTKQVAAWLKTEELIEELGDVSDYSLIILPGQTTGDEYDLERRLGVRVVKGPGCYSSLPDFFEEQGFEPVGDVPRPQIVVMEAQGDAIGRFLAKTYEIPYFDMGELIDLASIEDSPLGKEIRNSDLPLRHNVMAEIVRASLSMPNARNGWVLAGYPQNARDVQWLDDMDKTPDVFVAIVPEAMSLPILDLYREKDNIIEIDPALPVQDVKEQALVRVETLMQTCVAKGDRS